MPDLAKAIRGVGVTPVTPFDESLDRVDLTGLESNLRYLVDSGVGLVYPAGNTGEAMSLSPEEWTRVVETTVEACGDSVAVMPGIGHEYPTALELARRAGALGVDGLLLMPRSQPYTTSTGMIRYWRAIAEAAGVPVVVYKKELPDHADLLEVADDDGVIACKYADKDVSVFATATGEAGPEFIWTCGLAERFAPFFYQAGAGGFTSGLANFAPATALEMHSALVAGDLASALEVRDRCLPFEEIRARNADGFNVAAVKAAMDEVGLAGGRVRPPLVDLDDVGRVDVKNVLAAFSGAGN